MEIVVLAVGKIRDRDIRALTEDYLERLAHYLPVDHVEVREAKGKRSDEELRAIESAALREHWSSDAVTIAMDERGKQWTSHELAAFVEEQMISGVGRVVFTVGGARGLDAETKRQARYRLALSRMTFPHELARLMLAEQLYRALTIIRGVPYHK